jgi:arsenite-transporting ATPase
MLRFPDALRIFMDHFFDIKRKGARLLRPLLERIGANTFLPSEEVFDAFERLYGDIEDVRQILLDTDRTSARLVVNPARVVIDETRRSFAYLSLYGVATDAVLVNRLLPPDAVGGYFARWAEREREALADVECSFPVPLFRAPLQPQEVIGVEALTALSVDVFGERDPAALFTRTRPIRLRKRGRRTLLEIDLPGVTKEEIDVAATGSELFVHVRDAHRRIALPASLAGCRIDAVSLREGVLQVAFEA